MMLITIILQVKQKSNIGALFIVLIEGGLDSCSMAVMVCQVKYIAHT